MPLTTETHNDSTWLTSDRACAQIASADGAIRFLASQRTEPNFLSAPVAVTLTDVATGNSFALTGPAEALQTDDGSVCFMQRVPGSAIRVKTTITLADDLTWTLELINTSYDRREITVTFDFPGLSRNCAAFVASPTPHPQWRKWPHQYGYRCDENTFRHILLDPDIAMVIPALTLYRPADGDDAAMGLTIMSPLESPVQPFGVRLDSDLAGPRVTRPHLRIEPRASTATTLRVGWHEPHWRTGLGYIVDKYPENFEPADPDVAPLNGGFAISPPAPDVAIQNWKAKGADVVEMHLMHPFHGKYDHDQETWLSVKDDRWHYDKHRPDAPPDGCSRDEAFAYLESRYPHDMSREKIHDYIDRLHKHGLEALLYFMPTEVLAFEVFENFPRDAVLDEQGRTIRNWHELIITNPDPDGEWGRHALYMLEDMLDRYPEADGIFFDEAFNDLLDYAHDDGFSIRNGRPASRMGHAIIRFVEKALPILRNRGKKWVWNGPFQIELARYADGTLCENGEPAMQWLALRNKMLTGGGIPGGYGHHLLTGTQYFVFFMATYLNEKPEYGGDQPPDDNALPDPFRPLFDEVRQRTWVLSADPLVVPDCVKANIFRTIDGNVAVVLFSMWSQGETDFVDDLPVSVAESALDDADQVKAVYLLSADYPGWYCLDWQRRDGHIDITVPRHRGTSMILLATTGVFVAVTGPMFTRPGQTPQRQLRVDNWTSVRQPVQLRLADDRQTVELEPGASVTQPLAAPGDEPVLVELAGDGFERRFGQSVTALPAIELSRLGSLDGVVGQTRPLQLNVANNTGGQLSIALSAQAQGLGINGLPASINVPANQRQTIDLAVALSSPGVHELRFTAQAGSERAVALVPAAAAATDFFAGQPLTAGCVEFDLFSPQGQADPRAADPGKAARRFIYLNGTQIGAVGSKDHPRWFDFFRAAIPKDALMTLGRTATLEIHAADAEDFFMIRNVRILLDASDPLEFIGFEARTGGPRVATNRIEQTFSSCAHELAQGSIGAPVSMTVRFDGSDQ